MLPSSTQTQGQALAVPVGSESLSASQHQTQGLWLTEPPTPHRPRGPERAARGAGAEEGSCLLVPRPWDSVPQFPHLYRRGCLDLMTPKVQGW